MTRRHPWAALRDYAGNMWCGLAHQRHYWAQKYPGPHRILGERLERMVECRRCGRLWHMNGEVGEFDGTFTALTTRYVDTARTRERGGQID
jgi:hypothetical protein